VINVKNTLVFVVSLVLPIATVMREVTAVAFSEDREHDGGGFSRSWWVSAVR
jgi:hypothetical protein